MRSLWIHGWACNSRVFEPLLAALPSELAANATALDLPGYGGPNPGPDPEPDYGRFLRGRIEQESSRGPLLLAGWSMGAMAALEVAASAADGVAGLVLISGCARFVRETDNPGGQDPRAVRAMIQRLGRGSGAVVAQFQGAMFAGGEESLRDAYLSGPGKRYRGIPVKTLSKGLHYLLNSNLRPILNKITCPVLLVHGSRDTVIDLTLAQALADSLGDARLRVLDGAGHAPLLTRAGTTAKSITEFVLAAC